MRDLKNVYRRYALAGATFSCAISIGFLMQAGEPGHAAQAIPLPSDLATGVAQASLPSGDLGQLTDIREVSALPSPPVEATSHPKFPSGPVIVTVSLDAPVGTMPTEESVPALSCDTSLTANVTAAAMVDLVLNAPCLAGERVVIHHGGLKFSELVGTDGSLTVSVPAMAEQALFLAAFASGEGEMVRAEVTSLPFYDRVAVQWQGETGLELHALEYGATYGDSGHVWKETPRDISAVNGGEGGFLTRLGNPDLPEARMVEIYTFPSGTAQQEGDVALSIEAEVHAANCAREITAESFQVAAGGPIENREVALMVPDCDAQGQFLVLKNILEDMTIARN